MRLVHHQQRHRPGNGRQDAVEEADAGKLLRVEQQDVHLARPDSLDDPRPVSLVGRVERFRPQPQPLGRRDLVPHQGEQRGHQQRRPGSGLTQQLGGDKIDEALAPPGLLHHQQPPAALDDMADRVLLPVPERSIRLLRPKAEELKGALRIVCAALRRTVTVGA